MVSSDGSHQKFIPRISFPIWWVLSFKSPKNPYHFSNGCPVKVMVLAATNRPWDLDEALRRWGCSNRKNMGWIPDGCFFATGSKLMDMMDMIWYDLQNLPSCTRIHILVHFFGADVGNGGEVDSFRDFVLLVFSRFAQDDDALFDWLAFSNASFWRQSILEMG